MFRTASSKLALAAVATLATTGVSQAITVYSLLTPKDPPNFIGDRNVPVANGTYIYDDVNVDNALLGVNTALRINQIRVGILRDPGAPATTVSFRLAETNPQLVPFPILDSGTVQTIGSVPLAAYSGGVPTVDLVDLIFAPGTGPIVNLEFADQPGYGQFAVGVAFGDNSPKNTWAVHDYTLVPPQLYLNLDGAWSDSFVPYSLTFGGNDIYTTFMLGIDASPIPEPASLSLLALGALPMLRRRRA